MCIEMNNLNNLNKIRIAVAFVTAVFAVLFASGLFTMPSSKELGASEFSSARVVEDLKVIAKEHHSVIHPQERDSVASYLVRRLQETGADTVTVFEYDSLSARGFDFNVKDIYAEFKPVNADENTSYLMMIAHYDSRYPEQLAGRETLSYGAADDGYGLGVILETLNQLMKSHQYWAQGVKVLFTDAEEVGLVGMKSVFAHNPEIFSHVGLAVNVEARGTWGPALLFETSSDNAALMNLYASTARHPYTYSLTSVVYEMMPNFTDFMIIKDSTDIPGFNFSSVADINRYHTEYDCIENISGSTIQHYGEQIVPLTVEYLTNKAYSDRKSLQAGEDAVFFTMPLVGMFKCSKATYLIINISVFVIFLLYFAFEILRGRMRLSGVLKSAGVILAASVAFLGIGELVAYIASLVAGTPFRLFGIVNGILSDNLIMLVTAVLSCVLVVAVYLKRRASVARATLGSMRASAAYTAVAKHALTVAYGTMLLLFVLSAVFLGVVGENFMFSLPLTFGVAAMALWRMTNLKLLFPVSVFMIILAILSFLSILSLALTIGAFGAVLFIGILSFILVVSLTDLYVTTHK